MSEAFSIRGAQRNESARIAQLLEPEAAALGIDHPHGVAEYVRSTSKAPEVDWMVAVEDQQVIGAARTEMFSLDVLGRPLDGLLISNLVIDPAKRRQGIATELLGCSIAFGEERLLNLVKLDVLFEDVAVQALAAKTGFGSKAPYVIELLRPDYQHAPAILADRRRDARIPTPQEKKARFIKDAYPEADFKPEEIDAVFKFLPQIVEPYKTLFHPRTRKRLDRYVDVLLRYTASTEPTRKMLPTTGFYNQTALFVWKSGFAKAIATAITADNLKIMVVSLAAQETAD